MRAVPAQIKIIRGTHRKDRDGSKLSVDNLNSIPMPPSEFQKVEKDLWMTLCSTLFKLGILQATGIHVIYTYCMQHYLFRTAQADVVKRGATLVYENQYGTVEKKNPNVEAMNTHWNIMHQIGREFGFTPSSQAKIKNIGFAGNKDKAEEADEFDNI